MKTAKSVLEKLNKVTLDTHIEESLDISKKEKIIDILWKNYRESEKEIRSLVSNNEATKDHMKKFSDFNEVFLSNLEEYVIGEGATDEGMHYSTKVRQVEGSYGTRKAKMAVREAKRMVEELLDINHPSPNPVNDDSKQLLLDSVNCLSDAHDKIAEAKVAKRIRKEE